MKQATFNFAKASNDDKITLTETVIPNVDCKTSSSIVKQPLGPTKQQQLLKEQEKVVKLAENVFFLK